MTAETGPGAGSAVYAYFESRDAIMASDIRVRMRDCFKAGGSPSEVVKLLAERYRGQAELSNVLADWLTVSGLPQAEVEHSIESHVQSLVRTHFQPQLADSIFHGSQGAPEWLQWIIARPAWRAVLYALAEQQQRQCTLLNYAVQRISERVLSSGLGTSEPSAAASASTPSVTPAGTRDGLDATSRRVALGTAASYLPVFNRALAQVVPQLLLQTSASASFSLLLPPETPWLEMSGGDSHGPAAVDDAAELHDSSRQQTGSTSGLPAAGSFAQTALLHFRELSCQGEHTFLYTQALLQSLVAKESPTAPSLRRLTQELYHHLIARHAAPSSWALNVWLLASGGWQTADVASGLLQRLHHDALLAVDGSNFSIAPADVTKIHELYSNAVLGTGDLAPLGSEATDTGDLEASLSLLRHPVLFEALIAELFDPSRAAHVTNKATYISLLSLASASTPTEYETTRAALEHAQRCCQGGPFGAELAELLPQLKRLAQESTVVSAGLVHWLWCTIVRDRDEYYEAIRFSTVTQMLHMEVIGHIASVHKMLHPALLRLLKAALHHQPDRLDPLAALSVNRVWLDIFLWLFASGHVLPVLHAIHQWSRLPSTDLALVRYFALQAMEISSPPFSAEFVRAMLSIAGSFGNTRFQPDPDVQRTIEDWTSAAAASCQPPLNGIELEALNSLRNGI